MATQIEELNQNIKKLENVLITLNNTITNSNTSVGGASHTISSFNNYKKDNPFDEDKNPRKYKQYEKLTNKEEKASSDFYKKNVKEILELQNLQSDFQRQRQQIEIDFWKGDMRDTIIALEQHQVEMQSRRREAELELWKEKGDIIKEQEEYQIKLQQARQIKELDFYEEKKGKIKELDELESSLTEKRRKIELQQREAKLLEEEWEQRGYNNDGKKNSFAELTGAIGKATSYFKSNSLGRVLSDGLSKATNGTAKATKFLASDDKLSISDIGNKLSDITSKFGAIGSAIGGIIQLIAEGIEAYDKINAASSKYARSVGGGVTKMQQMKVLAVDVAKRISGLGKNVYDFNEILENTSDLSEKTGRAMDHITDLDFKSLADLKRHGIDSETLNMYDTFGLSVEEIDKKILGIYQKAGKHGLNAKAVTDTVNKNLKMAQQYTFASGQRALERMAEKSVSLKYNLESVSKFADKVSTLEGAATAGAQLSVLGGDFARMGNPLSMLYGGLQDPERLNEMMLNMTKNMAQWDTKKGHIDISSAFNRLRLKAASDATGIDYNDLLNMAYGQAKQRIISSQIKGGIDSETEKYIQNLATIKQDEKTGKAQAWVKINGEDKLVEHLNPEDKEALKKESEAMEQKNAAGIGDIYQDTRTITDTLNDYIKWFKGQFFSIILKIAGYDEKTVSAAAKYNLDVEDTQKIAKAKRESDRSAALNTGLKNGTKTAAKWGATTALLGGSGAIPGFIVGFAKGAYNGYVNGDESFSADDYASELAKADKYQKKAFGGEIRGSGTSRSDSIPAMLSDGEFVMNARAAQQHLPTLKAWNNAGAYANGGSIKAGNNQTNYQPVYNSIDRLGDRNSQTNAISIDPININISGTINLTGGGNTKSFDVKDVLNNPTIISQLVRRIEESVNYGLDKHKVHMKYPEPIIV